MATAAQRIQNLTQVTTTDKPKVALDTCCVQYYISNPAVQPWADCLDPIFRAGLAGKIDLYVSQVVVSELLAQVHYANRHNVGFDPELDFLAIICRHFQILDVNEEVARSAGRLRGNYIPNDKIILKTPDAIIGATSIINGHTLFVTNDAQLAKALPGANCLYLRDMALEWLTEKFPSTCFSNAEPVIPAKRGAGLPEGLALASLELGSIKPDPTARWIRILKDAFTVASALNEPCIFFILDSKNGRKRATEEVIFWHEGLAEIRPPRRVLKRLQDHLGLSSRTGIAANRNNIYVFCFTSLRRERARRSQSCFTSKNDNQRENDALCGYLSLFRKFKIVLEFPQTSWLLCEDGIAKELDMNNTLQFLNQAKNVLGWVDE